MNVPSERIYGFYDRADQPIDQPTYNPSLDSPCLFCGSPLTEYDIRTHAIMPTGAKRSYFYRTHRSCHESAGDHERNMIDGVVLDAIANNGD